MNYYDHWASEKDEERKRASATYRNFKDDKISHEVDRNLINEIDLNKNRIISHHFKSVKFCWTRTV